jgi:hypothetical protein
MGTVKTEVNDLNDLTIHSIHGKVTAKELSEKIESFYAVNPTRLALWDFSEADLKEITAEDIRTLAEFTQRFLPLRGQGKTALVFSTDFTFGLGRMYDITQNLGKSDVVHRSFRNKNEALEWLNEAEKSRRMKGDDRDRPER